MITLFEKHVAWVGVTAESQGPLSKFALVTFFF